MIEDAPDQQKHLGIGRSTLFLLLSHDEAYDSYLWQKQEDGRWTGRWKMAAGEEAQYDGTEQTAKADESEQALNLNSSCILLSTYIQLLVCAHAVSSRTIMPHAARPSAHAHTTHTHMLARRRTRTHANLKDILLKDIFVSKIYLYQRYISQKYISQRYDSYQKSISQRYISQR